MAVTVGFGPGAAQLFQGVGAEGAEDEVALRLQYPAHFRESVIERIAPLQHQVAEDDVDARGLEGKARGIAANTLEAAEKALVASGLAQHAGREIEGDHHGAAVAALELRGDAAGAGSEVENDLGTEVEGLEATEQLIGHPRLQYGRGLVARARTIEGGAHAGLVELKEIGGCRRSCLQQEVADQRAELGEMRQEWRMRGAADFHVAGVGKTVGECVRGGRQRHAIVLACDDESRQGDVAEQRTQVGFAQQLEAAGECRQAGISVGEEGRAQLLQRLGAARAAADLQLQEIADRAPVIRLQTALPVPRDAQAVRREASRGRR